MCIKVNISFSVYLSQHTIVSVSKLEYNTQCIIQSVFVISSSTPHGDRPTRNEPPVARKENGRAPLVTVVEEPLATLKRQLASSDLEIEIGTFE